MTDYAEPIDCAEPIGVVDRLLWRDAQIMLERHVAADDRDLCAWCGWSWPCAPHRLAQQAEAAAFQPWNDPWPVRQESVGQRATSGRYADAAGPPPRHAVRNRGTFELCD